MPLSPGTRLGPYEVLGAIGAGGMGEVYRARDTTLGRDVALKILPESFAGDPDRLMRFDREARTLAALNHPNIAAIYGLEGAVRTEGPAPATPGVMALVMELVEGDDLSALIARGPVPIEEALPIARQIASGLEAAHEAGVIHRDLKPANVKVKADGTVKVLDFGLAKASPGDGSGLRQQDPAPSVATMTSPAMTAMGMILGTASYMAPEQAKGRPTDRRADIWAFGVVLFEMLSGRRLFEAEDVSETLAAVLTRDVDTATLPASVPRPLRALVGDCLIRDPKQRLRDIGDARIVIDRILAGTADERGDGTASAPPAAMPHWRRALPWAFGTIGLIVGIAGFALRASPPDVRPDDRPVARFAIPLPPDALFSVTSYPGRALAVSPDGTTIVYQADSPQEPGLRVRHLDDTKVRVIPGTEGGRAPFFSPDGEWIGFFTPDDGALKKISVRGGRAVTLARGFANAGWMLGTWCEDGRIVFDTWNAGLRVISAEGGEPRALTQPEGKWHLHPEPLPGPCTVLFFSYDEDGTAAEAIAVDTGSRIRILDHASHPRYLQSGHLLFVRNDALHVAPFDADALAVTGPATPLPFMPMTDWINTAAGNPQLGVSRDGMLVYVPSPDTSTETPLVSVTLDGQVEPVGSLPFISPMIVLSPDGTQLTVTGRRNGAASVDALDLGRKAFSALVDLGNPDAAQPPVWMPDGKAILFPRYGPTEGEIVRHVLDGSAPDEVLVREPGTWFCPWSVSPDGRYLLFSRYVPETGADLLRLDLTAAPLSRRADVFVATPASDYGAAISPNGDWVAYYSDASGRPEILLEAFPDGGKKTRVWSSDRNTDNPIWSPDGQELYFIADGDGANPEQEMMAVRLGFSSSGVQVGQPRTLFSGPFITLADSGPSAALTPDGRRFLLMPAQPLRSGNGGRANQLMVVENWFTELSRQASGAER